MEARKWAYSKSDRKTTVLNAFVLLTTITMLLLAHEFVLQFVGQQMVRYRVLIAIICMRYNMAGRSSPQE